MKSIWCEACFNAMLVSILILGEYSWCEMVIDRSFKEKILVINSSINRHSCGWHFAETSFKYIFLNNKILVFWNIFHWRLLLRTSWQYVITGSGNGLVLYLWRTITLKLDYRIVWCHMVSLCFNELQNHIDWQSIQSHQHCDKNSTQ